MKVSFALPSLRQLSSNILLSTLAHTNVCGASEHMGGNQFGNTSIKALSRRMFCRYRDGVTGCTAIICVYISNGCKYVEGRTQHQLKNIRRWIDATEYLRGRSLYYRPITHFYQQTDVCHNPDIFRGRWRCRVFLVYIHARR